MKGRQGGKIGKGGKGGQGGKDRNERANEKDIKGTMLHPHKTCLIGTQ